MTQPLDPTAPATQRDIAWLAELVAETRNKIAERDKRFDAIDERLRRLEENLRRIGSALHSANVGQRGETLEQLDRRVTGIENAICAPSVNVKPKAR